jgi:hypothetical protein
LIVRRRKHIKSKKYVFVIIAGAVLALLAIALWWAPEPSSPSALGVSFLGYKNGTQAVFRITNPSSDTHQLASSCVLISEQWRPLGSAPLVGAAASKPLLPHSDDIVTISRPLGVGRWRVQFYAEPVGLRRQWHLMRIAAHRVGLPVRNPGMPSLGGSSDIIEP